MNCIRVLLLICLLPQGVWAIKKPHNTGMVGVLQYILNQSNDLDKKVVNAEKQLVKEQRRINKKDQVILRIKKDIAKFKKKRDIKRNIAIRVALRIYHIVPIEQGTGVVVPNGALRMPIGTIEVPEYSEGKRAHWIPVARDNESRVVIDKNGEPKTISKAVDPKTLREPEAVAGLDGVTSLFSNVRSQEKPHGAFTSAADLALTLHHELIHFEQYTTKGRGDELTFNDREVEAWRETAAAAGRIGLSATDEEEFRKKAMERFRDYQGAAKAEKNMKMLPRSLWWSQEPSYLLPHAPEELEQIHKDHEALARAMNEAREKARRSREELEERLAREEAERRREQESRRVEELRVEALAAVQLIRDLAAQACLQPSSLGDREAQRFLSAYGLFNRHWHEPGFPGRDALPKGLSPCAERMVHSWAER